MKKKLYAGVTVLVVGVATLAVGLALMLTKLTSGPALRDAEYLVEVGTWVREDAPEVVWSFTEVGKGNLTTNEGTNEYDFIWAIEGERLLIETDWLYTLNDEYNYEIDRGEQRLILDGATTFRPAEQGE